MNIEEQGVVNLIQLELERAFRTAALMPSKGTRPAGYKSNMPETVKEWDDLFEVVKNSRGVKIGTKTIDVEPELPRRHLTNEDYTHYDTFAPLLTLIPATGNQRQIVATRSITKEGCHPLEPRRHLISYKMIGRKFGISATLAATRYQLGLKSLVPHVSGERFQRFFRVTEKMLNEQVEEKQRELS